LYILIEKLKKNIFIFTVIFLLVCNFIVLSQEVEVKKFVTDETGTLTSEQITSLESKLINFETETSNQVVVYMMSSLNGGSLEETSWDIAEKNGIGQKGKDNGVLLFVVKDDRLLRIEVGYGLEGALPDALASQIIRKEITPYFKQSQYYEGINAGVDAIIKATKGEYTADKTFTQNKKDKESPTGPTVGCCGLPFFFIIIFLFIGIFIISNIFRRIFGGGKGYGRRNGGIFFPGGFGGSGSSWGGSGGFGGFSGGGGSFGGGGSSGSW
jgi:uncharacterized protein